MTRLEIQNKLIAKFGNTLNEFEKERFEKFFLRTFKVIPKVLEKFTTVELEDGQEVSHQIIGSEIKVNEVLITPLFAALVRLSKTEFRNEVLGDILCYEPALMNGSDTTMCYTSWALAFRFDQEAALSEEATQIIIGAGFKLGLDKGDKQYFIIDDEKLLK
jgi:hypothetical protein